MQKIKLKLYYAIMLFAILYIIFSVPTLAAENVVLDEYTQIDIKENVDVGLFGSVEHTPELIDKLVYKDKIYVYLAVRDDNYHSNLIITYDFDGKEINRVDLGTKYSVTGKFYLSNDNKILLFTSYTNEVKRNSIILFDEDGNILGRFNDTNSSKPIGSQSVIAEDETYIYYLTDSSTYFLYTYSIKKNELLNGRLSLTSTIYSPTSSKDVYHLLSTGKRAYVLYEYYYKKKSNEYYLIPFKTGYKSLTSTDAEKYNIWPYQTSMISSVEDANGDTIINSSNGIYIYDESKNSIAIYETTNMNELLMNKEKVLRFIDDICIINCDDENITVTKNADNTSYRIDTLCDSYEWKYSNEKISAIYDGLQIIIKNNDKYVCITNGEILTYNSNGEVLNGDPVITFTSAQRGNSVFKIYGNNNYNLEITKINDKLVQDTSSTIYCGANGLIIEGRCNFDDNIVLTFELENIKKETNVFNGTFLVTFTKDELYEGVYDFIKIYIDEENDNAYYFDELPLESSLYYDDILYTKIDSNLVFEKYPDSNNTLTKMEIDAYSLENKEDYLTEDEFNKYKSIIFNENKYVYWLSSGNSASSNSIITVKSKNSGYGAYIRKKKIINLNEKFRFNEKDNNYYSISNEKDNEIILDKQVRVSYAKCNDINAWIDKNENVTSDNFKLIIEKDADDDKVVINTEIKNVNNYKREEYILERIDFETAGDKLIYEKTFEDDGDYSFDIYAFNDYGNESERRKLRIILDNSSPIIDTISYKGLTEFEGKKYSNQDQIKCEVIVKDLSMSQYDLIDEYTYKIIYTLKNGEKINEVICDDAGNKKEVLLYADYIVDKDKPMVDIACAYYDSFAKINVSAKDNCKVNNIYYSLDNKDYFEYKKEVVLERAKYNRNTKIYVFATDIAGNKSDITVKEINLNSIPKIELLSKIKNTFDMSNLPLVKLEFADEDNDELNLEILVNDELLYSKKLLENTYTFDGNEYFDYFKMIDKKTCNKLIFKISDGLDSSKIEFNLNKINSKPQIKVNTKKLNFKECTMLDIDAVDLDDDALNLTILLNDKRIMTKQIISSKQNIVLNDKLNYGTNDITIIVNDENDRAVINKKINVLEQKVFNNDENVIVKLKDEYSDEFIDVIMSKYSNVNKLIINNCTDNNYLKNKFIDKEIILNNISKYSLDKRLLINNELTIDEIELLVKNNDKKTLYIETGEDFLLSEIKLYDYERDYSNEDLQEGKNRILNVLYNPLSFENTIDKKETMNYLYEEDRDKIKVELNDAGKYTLILSEYDDITFDNNDYSKKSDDEVITIFSHHRPSCNLTYDLKENENTYEILLHKDAYDKDFASVNNGISKAKIEVKNLKNLDTVFEREYYSVDVFKDESISLDKNSEYAINYYVWDYGIDINTNEFTLSNTASINIVHDPKAPIAYYEYDLLNKKNIDYLYALDACENVMINEKIEYNDDFAEDSLRDKKYTYEIEDIKELALNNEESFEIKNNLYVKNKHQLESSYSRNLNLIKLNVKNNTTLDYDKEDGFEKVSDLDIKIEIDNEIKSNDISLLINNELCMYESEKGIYNFTLTKDYINSLLTKSEDEYSLATFDIYIYSNRDESLLGVKTFYVKYFNLKEITNYRIVKIYDPSLKYNYPIEESDMPAKYIKKGYAFQFEIETNGYRDDEDEMIVDVTYYFADNDGNVLEQIDLKKKNINNKLEKYIIPLYYNDVETGTNYKIKLDKRQRYINGDKEVWNGLFYVPSDALVLWGNKIRKDGYILVCFNIAGYENDNLVSLYINPYSIMGETVIYDNSKSVNNDVFDYKIY